ncbi:MAG: class I SAM-dependent methyltransferase [Anaerolineales bacterium]
MSQPVCRICGSVDSKLIGSHVSDAPESSEYQCQQCGIVYLYPIMSEKEEADFYRAEFEKYMAGRSGAGWKSPQAHFRSYQPEGERRLPLVRPFLKQNDDVLEIGSSTAYFLDDLRGYVGSVTGVEPSEAYREYANGLGLQTYESLGELTGRSFDVIFLYYVLEHLRDPIGYMSSLASWLKPGGRILLEVPNVDDVLLGPYTIPAFAPFYWQKAHYYNFSHRTLSDVLTRAGYTVQVLPAQRYDLSNHMVWMMDGKPGGAGRFKELFTPELETAYAEALKRNWKCDTLFAVMEVKP